MFSVLLASVTSVFVFSFNSQQKNLPLKPEIYADDFLEDYLNVIMSDEEKQYLKSKSGFLISFNSHIPASSVETYYDIENEILNVRANEYTYNASNGVSVIWKPVSVTFDSQTLTLEAPDYLAHFTDVSVDVSEKVDVEFSTEFVIEEAKINELLSFAYTNAPLHDAEINEKREEYERLNSEYILNKQKYENYLLMSEAYSEYLSEKRIYDEKFAEYTEYQAELEKFKEQKEKFDAYVIVRDEYYRDYALYLDYLAYVSVNQSKIYAYEKYTENIAKARAQLEIIKGIKLKATSLNRSVYSAIMGDTVTSVIANKDAIANEVTGADSAIVDLAGAATQNLRALFNGFFSITDENEMYNYYVVNYEGFRDNFANLFKALDKLYMYPKVRSMMIYNDKNNNDNKQEKYLILLAELFYVTNALSDTAVMNYDGTAAFDSNYIIGKGYNDAEKPIAIMEGKEYMKDANSAAPLPEGYPQPVEKPEFTEEITEPPMPTPVDEPKEPEYVEKPTEPTAVSEPEFVNHPGNPPEEYVPDADMLMIAEAFKNGKLTARSEYEGNFSIKPKIILSKAFYNVQFVTVTFYDREYTDKSNAEIIYQTTVERGSFADYSVPVPQKEEDFDYYYTHSGWSDEEGGDADLSVVNKDIELYPTFAKTAKIYKTIWVVDGIEYSAEPQKITKPISGNFCYFFDGWQEVRDKYTCTVTKTARFRKEALFEAVSGAGEVTYTDTTVNAAVGTHNDRYKLDNLLANFAGKYAVSLKTAKGSIAFSYSDFLAMKNAGVSSLDISVTRRADSKYTYGFSLYDADGNEITAPIKATFTASCISDDPARLELYSNESGVEKLNKSVCDGSDISFIAVCGKKYSTALNYKISSLPIEALGITLDKTIAEKGENVSVSVSAPLGIKINRIYFIDSSGAKHDINDGGFTMLGGDVTVGVDYEIEEYVISFVSDGKIIASFICRYGDTVTPPKNPQKAATDTFSYNFIGWSEEITPAVKNVVYTAVYERKVIPNEGNSGLQITPSVMKILLLAVSACVMLVLVLIPSGIMTLVLVKKRKRKLKIKQ